MKGLNLKDVKRIFTGYFAGKVQDEEYQRKVIVLVAWIAAPTAAIFSLVNFLNNHIWLGGVEVFAIALLFPCFRIIHNHGHLSFARDLLMADATLVFVALYVDGGIAGDGMTWTLIFPFLASLLMGLPYAWYWILAFSTIILGWTIAHFMGLYQLVYTEQAIIFFPGTFIFFSLIAAAFEVQLERLRIQREETIIELKDLRDHLQDNVQQRTAELQKSNNRLKREIEQHMETTKALKEAEARFYQAQKMESIGTLVGGIAHDFNNMLSGIHANLFMIKRKLINLPEVEERIDSINQLVKRAAEMIKQLLTFARKDNVEYKIFNLRPFISEAYKLATVSISSTIALSFHAPKEDIWVKANATQLQQVLMNLVNNARDALKGAETPQITIALGSWSPDADFVKRHPELHTERYARVSVSDNGSGIDNELLTRIFEPFFTTKGVGKGTGLGLAMCYGAIQGHSGSIEVESELGKGTTFHILLPEYIESDEGFQLATFHGTEYGHGEYILLADDDPMLRHVQNESLTALGYHVIQASNGREAVEQFKKYQDQIRLVILEVVMPVMGGVRAAGKIRELKQDVPVIYVQGYDPADTLSADNLPSSEEMILDKPFTVHALSRAVRNQLKGESPESLAE